MTTSQLGASTKPQRPGSTGWGWPPSPLAFALAGLAVLAYVALLFPYHGDQALYALIGRDVLAGRTLYGEISDIKQPGVFLWYGAVTRLFGFSQLATRALDVLAVVSLGLLIRSLLRARLATPWVRRWTAVLVIAVLLMSVSPLALGQVEMLCLVPAVAAFVLVGGAPKAAVPIWRTVGAGLYLGVIVVFKLVLAAVPAGALVVYLLLAGQARTRLRIRSVLVAALAATVPAAVTVAWLASAGALDDALRVWFVDPFTLVSAPGLRSRYELAGGALSYAAMLAPAIVLGGWQAGAAVRRRDALDLAMILWLALDIVVIVMGFWGSYHWFFLTPPLLVLAIRRLDALAPRLVAHGRRKVIALALLVLLCVPVAAHGLRSVVQTARQGGGFTPASRAAIAEHVARQATIQTELRAVGVTRGDSLYVFGDPLYNYLADLPIPVRTQGWGFEGVSRYWDDVAAEVRTARPTWILVDTHRGPIMAARGAALAGVLAGQYTVVRVSAEGTWYQLR